MYKNYKSSLVQPKKSNLPKGQQNKQQAKNTAVEKTVKPKPEWNDAVKEDNSYKLSASEMVQRKISLMSKHRLEAKEEWLERQEKLRKGIVDDETKRVYDTARQSKNLPSREDEIQRKNLSQMLNFIPKPQKDSKVVIENVKQDLQETRKFIEVMEQYQNTDDPNRVLRVMDRLRSDQRAKQNSQSTLQSQKGLDSMRKSTRSISNQNIDSHKCTTQKEQRHSDKKKEEDENDIFSSSQKENKQDMANYFNSLDKIEETIKFMEDKIIGDRKSPKKQNIVPSSIVEKKLAEEIKDISEFNQKNLKNNNNATSLKEYNYFEDDGRDQFVQQMNYFDKNYKIQGKSFENSQDIKVGTSMNASKQINISKSKLDIDQCSFNLTEGDDESSINQYGNTLQNSRNRASRSRSQSFEKKINYNHDKHFYQNNKDNDLIVQDVKCNIDTIDPNMFFDNVDNEDDYEYEYHNQNKKSSTNIKLNNEDTLKSDYQKTFENNLYKNNNQDIKQSQLQQDQYPQKYQNYQQSSLSQNYDIIAERKKQELNSQVNTIKLQTNANDIFSKLKQQTEDDSDQFYASRFVPQQNNFLKQQPMNSYQYPSNQQTKPQNNYNHQEQQNEPEEEEDYLSRNIDQLREMLEATKKDLQKLETNENDEINCFSTQQQSQNLMGSSFQGKRMQNKIPITTNNEYNQYQETLKKNNITIPEKPQQKEINKPSNPPFVNQYQKLDKMVDNGMFINNEPYKNESNNFFQSNSESQNYFTSNLFLASGNNANNQQQTYGKNPFNY